MNAVGLQAATVRHEPKVKTNVVSMEIHNDLTVHADFEQSSPTERRNRPSVTKGAAHCLGKQ